MANTALNGRKDVCEFRFFSIAPFVTLKSLLSTQGLFNDPLPDGEITVGSDATAQVLRRLCELDAIVTQTWFYAV
jgi:hypothetical protein